nr:ATP-binding cassette domain-containing protein [Symmachiella dynata]
MPMSSASPLLQARHLGRKIPGAQQWLLKDINLQIAAGERLAIIGPTGSGKSVLLRALSGLDPIDAGEILWRGNTITNADVPNFRRQAIYLRQRPAIFEGTVESNLRIAYSLSIRGDAEFQKKRVIDLLTQAGRDADFLDKSAAELSGGEAQITALIRALQCDPTLLLLDEPTASLDPASATAVEQMVVDWQQADDSRAVIWVSHDPAQVLRIATREFALDHGAEKE